MSKELEVVFIVLFFVGNPVGSKSEKNCWMYVISFIVYIVFIV